MWRWAISSDALALALVMMIGAPAFAGVLMTQDEALAQAFPEAEVVRLTEFLQPEQRDRIAALAGSEPGSRLVVRYRGVRAGRVVGTAYFDAHPVRTLSETLMVVVDPEGRVVRVEVLSFDEPRDYLPRPRWFEQFPGRELNSELSLKRGIRGITGATLSSRAATAAVRRALATHQVLAAPDQEGQAQP
jgi:Na+-translocating ferredoxin:NAD+ oxidoreductase RnfG subunit